MKTRMNWGDTQTKNAKVTIGVRGELLLLISNLQEENGKGLTDIFNLPTRKQFQVTADTSRFCWYCLGVSFLIHYFNVTD